MVYIAALVILLFIIVPASIKIIYEYERGVVFLFGKYFATYDKGIKLLIPGVMTMVRVDMRLIALDVPSQDIITKDNVSITINAVVMYKVMEAEKAVIKVGDYHYNASLLSQTTLRATVGQHELDEVLSMQDRINARLQELLDHQTDPWGIKVASVAIKHVDLPQEMKRAMAKQAEAERERRAKIINAEGELQASEKLMQAAEMMGKHPMTLQLRYLQTLREIATENNSVTVFPLPMDIIMPIVKAASQALNK
ncbi:MAG: slipin family protein [Nitrospinae bacterium]|nr:slipin family protein [Nitrospinota bacterium]